MQYRAPPTLLKKKNSNTSHADHVSQALQASNVVLNSPTVANSSQAEQAPSVVAVQNSNAPAAVVQESTAALIDGLADRFRDYFQAEVRRFLNDGWGDRPRNTQILERFCQNCDSMQSFGLRPRANAKNTAGIKKPDRHEKQ